MNKSKEKRVATAQPCVAGKQPVGLLSPTRKEGFEGFVSFVTNNSTNKQSTIKQHTMNRDEIKQYLPHREPMLLVDEMTLDENHVAHSKYHVTGEEFFLQGHFPGEPVVPGVILCEIMAQSCALLMKDDLIGKLTFYTGIDKVRFKNSVKPGDTVEVEATLTYHMRNIYICSATLSVGGKMCVKGELSFALLPDTRNK